MPGEPSFCPVYASIELLQEKWTLHIIRALLAGSQGFNELGRTIGANPSTLVQRLDHLERVGIVERTVHSVMPPRTSYGLTPAGIALQEVIDAVARWGTAHIKEPPESKRRSRSGANRLQQVK
jgi:DNA-binding HxlR family transcriptional regulator